MDVLELHPSSHDLSVVSPSAPPDMVAQVTEGSSRHRGIAAEVLERISRRCRAVDLDDRRDVERQVRHVFFVKKKADWIYFLDKVEPDFVDNIREAGFLTLDTENRLKEGLESILMGNPVSGKVVVLRVVPLMAKSETLTDVIPQEWKDLLTDPTLWKFGVGIAEDLTKIIQLQGLHVEHVKRVVDLGDVVKGSSFIAKYWPEMARCSGSLKHICRIEQGVIYGVDNIRKNWGAPFDLNCSWHTYKIYRWPLVHHSERRSRPYRSELCCYLLNDGRYPYRFVAKLALLYLEIYPGVEVGEAFENLFSCYVGNASGASNKVQHGFFELSSSPPHVDEFEEIPADTPTFKARCGVCFLEGHETEDCQMSEEIPRTMELFETALQEGTKTDPSFPSSCDFCGSCAHHWDYCHARQAEVPCEYPFCVDPKFHAIKICPALHHRCTSCSIRGHFESHCGSFEEVSLPFLAFKSKGFFTQFCDSPFLTGKSALIHFGLFPVPVHLVDVGAKKRGFNHTLLVEWGLERALEVCKKGRTLYFCKRAGRKRKLDLFTSWHRGRSRRARLDCHNKL